MQNALFQKKKKKVENATFPENKLPDIIMIMQSKHVGHLFHFLSTHVFQ